MKAHELRLRRLEAELDPLAAVWCTSGLYSLLEAARQLPPRDDEALLDVEETSFTPLLIEARQWMEEHQHG
jgi:hypothetical protein